MIPTKRGNKRASRSMRKYRQNKIACQKPSTQRYFYGKELQPKTLDILLKVWYNR